MTRDVMTWLWGDPMGMGMSLKILGIWAGVAAVLFLMAYNGGSSVWLVLWLLVSAPAYWASLYLHPNRNCWYCRGTGQNRGALFDYSRRPCVRCGGTGTKPRLGRRVFFTSST